MASPIELPTIQHSNHNKIIHFNRELNSYIYSISKGLKKHPLAGLSLPTPVGGDEYRQQTAILATCFVKIVSAVCQAIG
jgi:hypothetical protein